MLTDSELERIGLHAEVAASTTLSVRTNAVGAFNERVAYALAKAREKAEELLSVAGEDLERYTVEADVVPHSRPPIFRARVTRVNAVVALARVIEPDA